MRVLVTFTLLTLFVFLPCSSDALTLVLPSWDYNISNMVKDTDLVVVGKITGMRLIPEELSTSITMSVESVIKGDKAIGDRLLRFKVRGNAGMKKHKGEHIHWHSSGSLEFSIGERLLLFMDAYDGNYIIFRPGGKIMVRDNKVYIPYTDRVYYFDDYYNEMRKANINRYVELALELVIKVGKASVREYDAIAEIEADVAEAVSEAYWNRCSEWIPLSVPAALLKRLEDKADWILNKKGSD